MTLYIIGLGLGDEKDVTLRGLEYIKTCDVLFLEAYTSILSNSISSEHLSKFYEKEVKIADRTLVESEADQIINPAINGQNVGLLIVGDPVCATTHTDIMIRAREVGVEVKIVHNASVMGAVGSCGLQLYNYGQTVSIPFFEENWRPYSFYEKIQYNRKVSERSEPALGYIHATKIKLTHFVWLAWFARRSCFHQKRASLRSRRGECTRCASSTSR
tara:strand:+ start:250 stop:897 length:648 start_codon:yes stop_codon:yes gene_type:complete